MIEFKNETNPKTTPSLQHYPELSLVLQTNVLEGTALVNLSPLIETTKQAQTGLFAWFVIIVLIIATGICIVKCKQSAEVTRKSNLRHDVKRSKLTSRSLLSDTSENV